MFYQEVTLFILEQIPGRTGKKLRRQRCKGLTQTSCYRPVDISIIHFLLLLLDYNFIETLYLLYTDMKKRLEEYFRIFMLIVLIMWWELQ